MEACLCCRAGVHQVGPVGGDAAGHVPAGHVRAARPDAVRRAHSPVRIVPSFLLCQLCCRLAVVHAQAACAIVHCPPRASGPVRVCSCSL